MSSIVSPFAIALPASNVFTAYDADGDAIMTDAVTGLPITYGGSGSKRSRSASLDSDSADSRPSKRSRTSSEGDGDGENEYADMPPLIPANPPPAPKKAQRAPVGIGADGDQDGDGHESALRNLAEQMAAVVLEGEPRDPPAEPAPQPAVLPPGGGPQDGEDQGWCMSVTCSDLALRLDMRHPRVVLNLLRFVTTYNELAPPGEDIHFPLMPPFAVQNLLSHESLVNPPAEFQAEVDELRALVDRYSAPPEDEDEDDDDGYSTDSSRRSWGRDRY